MIFISDKPSVGDPVNIISGHVNSSNDHKDVQRNLPGGENVPSSLKGVRNAKSWWDMLTAQHNATFIGPFTIFCIFHRA